MTLQFRGYEFREWLFGIGILLGTALWLGVSGVLIVSYYARDTILDAVGPVVMVALVGVYLLPLIGVYVYADRVRAFFREQSP